MLGYLNPGTIGTPGKFYGIYTPFHLLFLFSEIRIWWHKWLCEKCLNRGTFFFDSHYFGSHYIDDIIIVVVFLLDIGFIFLYKRRIL